LFQPLHLAGVEAVIRTTSFCCLVGASLGYRVVQNGTSFGMPIFKLFFNVISVLKATIENKTTSVTTHFKSASSSSKADTFDVKKCRM